MDNQPKKLYRSRKNRIIAGVAGGLGEYIGIDPVLIRILFVILIFPGGLGIILYFLLVLAIPLESADVEKERKGANDGIAENIKERARAIAEEFKDKTEEFKGRREDRAAARNIVGIFLVALGSIFLLGEIFPLLRFRWDIFWPIILIFVGFLILFK